MENTNNIHIVQNNYIFRERSECDELKCRNENHNWKLIVRCEYDNNVAIGICTKCAQLASGWAELEKDQ